MIEAVEVGNIRCPKVLDTGDPVGYPVRDGTKNRAGQMPCSEIAGRPDLNVAIVDSAVGVPGRKQVPGVALAYHARVVDENVGRDRIYRCRSVDGGGSKRRE